MRGQEPFSGRHRLLGIGEPTRHPRWHGSAPVTGTPIISRTPSRECCQELPGRRLGNKVHEYGPASPFAQRPLNHFFPTSGVCWHFSASTKALTEDIAEAVRAAFCDRFSVQPSDVGIGTFHARSSPLGPQTCQGMCLYDAVHGSLRLTERLAENFAEVVSLALDAAERDGHVGRIAGLRELQGCLEGMRPMATPGAAAAPVTVEEGDWMDVIVAGEVAMVTLSGVARETTVLGFRYTGRGPLYELTPEVPGVRQWVALGAVQPIHGQTRVERRNLLTDEVA